MKQWKDADDLELVGLVNFPFRLRARWFAKLLKESLRHGSQQLTVGYTVPIALMFWVYIQDVLRCRGPAGGLTPLTGGWCLIFLLAFVGEVIRWMYSPLPAGTSLGRWFQFHRVDSRWT